MNTPFNGIVPEALTPDNYDQWSILAKHYLMSEDLWVDVIENRNQSPENLSENRNQSPENSSENRNQSPENSSENRNQSPENLSENRNQSPEKEKKDAKALHIKKDAKALHIIKMSCGSETFSQIKETKTAKAAWNTLASLYKARLGANADIEQGLPSLHRGVQRGDWDTARTFMSNNRKARYATSKLGKTVLHVAVLTGQEDMVEKLVDKLPKRLLLERDTEGYTALARAAELSDNISIAKCMIERSDELLKIKTNEGEIPVVLAAIKGNKKMTKYLYYKTLSIEDGEQVFNEDSGETSALLLTRCISGEIFGVALDLLKRIPRIPLATKFDGVSPLLALAQQPLAFPSISIPKFWLSRWLYHAIPRTRKEDVDRIDIRLQTMEDKRTNIKSVIPFSGFLSCPLGSLLTIVLLPLRVINKLQKRKNTHYRAIEILKGMTKEITDLDEAKMKQALVCESLLEASKSGIVEFVTMLTKANPDLYWVIDENQRGIFSYAVLNRREKVFNLIYELKGQGKVIISRTDIFGNNMLHLTGILAPATELDPRSGPALQMQRELQWFKAVKGILHPKFQQDPNGDGMKPRELFTKKHEELLKDAEKWAKDTATSFTIVGTLIITIVFAAAFTLPGGNDQNTGIPLFLNKRMFSAYMVADAISLFASSTSVMTFIGIITSRYAERDFLISLPLKLMFGLITLFCSVLAMMVAFCSAFSLMLRDHKHFTIVKFVIAIASLSVVIFLPVQLRLVVEIFNSTFNSEVLDIKKIYA